MVVVVEVAVAVAAVVAAYYLLLLLFAAICRYPVCHCPWPAMALIPGLGLGAMCDGLAIYIGLCLCSLLLWHLAAGGVWW
jgi:hypothetical protein